MPRPKSRTWFEPGPAPYAQRDMSSRKPAQQPALRESGPGPNQGPILGPCEQANVIGQLVAVDGLGLGGGEHDLFERGPAGGVGLHVRDRPDEQLLVPRVLAEVVGDQMERHGWNLDSVRKRSVMAL